MRTWRLMSTITKPNMVIRDGCMRHLSYYPIICPKIALIPYISGQDE